MRKSNFADLVYLLVLVAILAVIAYFVIPPAHEPPKPELMRTAATTDSTATVNVTLVAAPHPSLVHVQRFATAYSGRIEDLGAMARTYNDSDGQFYEWGDTTSIWSHNYNEEIIITPDTVVVVDTDWPSWPHLRNWRR